MPSRNLAQDKGASYNTKQGVCHTVALPFTSSTMHRPMAQGIALQKKLLMRLLHLEEVAHAFPSP
jgi:hypothetical protein